MTNVYIATVTMQTLIDQQHRIGQQLVRMDTMQGYTIEDVHELQVRVKKMNYLTDILANEAIEADRIDGLIDQENGINEEVARLED